MKLDNESARDNMRKAKKDLVNLIKEGKAREYDVDRCFEIIEFCYNTLKIEKYIGTYYDVASANEDTKDAELVELLVKKIKEADNNKLDISHPLLLIQQLLPNRYAVQQSNNSLFIVSHKGEEELPNTFRIWISYSLRTHQSIVSGWTKKY
jgi:hypothetical protein